MNNTPMKHFYIGIRNWCNQTDVKNVKFYKSLNKKWN